MRTETIMCRNVNSTFFTGFYVIYPCQSGRDNATLEREVQFTGGGSVSVFDSVQNIWSLLFFFTLIQIT